MSDKIAIKYTTSDNRIITLSESNLPETTAELSPLEKRKLKIEIAALLALIATLFCYVVLAFLQYQANSISRDSIMAAHTVWVNIVGNPDIKVQDNTHNSISFTFENVSDTPAFKFHAFLQWKSPTSDWDQPPVDLWQPTDKAKTLLPHTSYCVTGNLTDLQSNVSGYAAAMNGTLSGKITVKYEDIYGRKVEIEQVFRRAEEAWTIEETNVYYEGYK